MAPSSAAGKWQARGGGSSAGQDLRHVTGVTERVWGDGDFTPSLQKKNQIRAIAPPSEQPRPTPQGSPGPRTGRRPKGARASKGRPEDRARSTVDAHRGGPEADRAGSTAPLPQCPWPRTEPARAQKRSRWTRRSPARSTTKPVGAGARRVELCAGLPGWGPGCALDRGVRPRCAAAEYPPAVRGPLPRGTGGVHRGYGWT